MIDLQGILVPLLTPFSADQAGVDENALADLIEFVVGAGTHGVIANASTSEVFHLSEAERYREAEFVVEHVRGRVPVLVGAGAPGTGAAISFAKHAERIGAAGLLVIPPYYAPLSKDAILRHYVALSDAVSLPIMLYNNPEVCGTLLTPDDIVRFVNEANVPWVKLTTKHVEFVHGLLYRLGDRVRIFEGVDSLAFPSMVCGAHGWVAGPANAIPDLAVELWKAVRVAKDLEAGYALQQRMAPLLDYMDEAGVYSASIKEVCRLRGHPMGAVRSPYEELTGQQIIEVRTLFERTGVAVTQRTVAGPIAHSGSAT